MESLWTSEKHNLVRYDCLQPHYNLVHRAEFERELWAVCVRYGLGVIPYSPIAGGLLSGKYRRGVKVQEGTRGWNLRHALTEKNFLIIDKLDEIAQTRGKPCRGGLDPQRRATSPIIGANTVEQWRVTEVADGTGGRIARLNGEE
jgi:aryl-alcohol dehydrogenase-like predicted oxidoreductase